jgi:hypothetical protein
VYPNSLRAIQTSYKASIHSFHRAIALNAVLATTRTRFELQLPWEQPYNQFQELVALLQTVIYRLIRTTIQAEVPIGSSLNTPSKVLRPYSALSDLELQDIHLVK